MSGPEGFLNLQENKKKGKLKDSIEGLSAVYRQQGAIWSLEGQKKKSDSTSLKVGKLKKK